jgi:hypothetical protein
MLDHNWSKWWSHGNPICLVIELSIVENVGWCENLLGQHFETSTIGLLGMTDCLTPPTVPVGSLTDKDMGSKSQLWVQIQQSQSPKCWIVTPYLLADRMRRLDAFSDLGLNMLHRNCPSIHSWCANSIGWGFSPLLSVLVWPYLPVYITWLYFHPTHFAHEDGWKQHVLQNTGSTVHFYMVPGPKNSISISNESLWKLKIGSYVKFVIPIWKLNLIYYAHIILILSLASFALLKELL